MNETTTATTVSNAALLPKTKGRESYLSGARLSFREAENVTAKEKDILEAIEGLNKAKKYAYSDSIAEAAGVNTHVINGALSVMIAKSLVSTERVRIESGPKGVKRIVSILVKDWRSLVGADTKRKADAKAAKPPKMPKEIKATVVKDKAKTPGKTTSNVKAAVAAQTGGNRKARRAAAAKEATK